MAKIEFIAYGPLDRMVAEFGTVDPVRGGRAAEYAVAIIGAGDWDSEYFGNREDAIAEAEYLAITYGVETIAV